MSYFLNDKQIMTYFENKVSFSLNIGLQEGVKVNYIIFKPYVKMVEKNREILDSLVERLKLQNSVIKLVKSSNSQSQITNKLVIQNFEDLETLTSFISANIKFVSSANRRKVLKDFISIYKMVLSVGHIHKEWDESFKKLVDMKLRLNATRRNISKNRYSMDDWINRMKKHTKIKVDTNGK